MRTANTIESTHATRAGARPALVVVPVTFDVACGFVEMWHRHHRPPAGHTFCVGIATPDGVLRGVAIVGRPTTRRRDSGQVLEATQVVTDGTANAHAALHAAAWRATKALGWTQLVPYTHQRWERES